MEKILKYREYIEKLILEYSQYKPKYGEIEVQTVLDTERDHYQLLNVGWDGNERIRGCVLQIDIKNGKIWIQHDGTEIGIANQLVEWGVSKQDIVLAYYKPNRRQYTEFAVQ
jgi:hypothetical protein